MLSHHQCGVDKMNTMIFPHRAVLSGCVAVLVGLMPGQALLLAQNAAPTTNVIAPTVTAAMGDAGGKIFGQAPAPAKTRHYYIAAEPELWDYAPEGRDPICGKPLPPPVVTQRRGAKLRYVEYTDASFGARVITDPRLGILGPTLRGVVGEYLAVTFLNRTPDPVSMHPHGVKYDKDSEGAYYEPKPGLGAAVGPGARFTYVWQLDESSGPLPDEPSSKGWLYHSHVNGDRETDLGLFGFIIVTDQKRARTDGTPKDVDREMAAVFMIFDESGLSLEAKEAWEYATLPNAPPPMPWAKIQELTEQGKRYAISGRIFGNLPGLEMKEGERVRWYLFGLGSESDLHTAHWHGARVIEDGRRRTDVVELLPASMKVADMVADNPGSWLFHCHVAEHMAEGMFARFTIHPRTFNEARSALEHPFFGVRGAQSSLRIKSAQAVLAPGQDGVVTLAGSVTVYPAFTVTSAPLSVQIGKKSISFKSGRNGRAQSAGGSLAIKNSGQFGVVYDGMMEFEVTLTGEDWQSELASFGTLKDKGELTVPVTVGVGDAQHHGSAKFSVRKP